MFHSHKNFIVRITSKLCDFKFLMLHLPVTCMSTLVVLHVPPGPETHPTPERAMKWLLVPMDSHVRFQTLSLSEWSVTVRNFALIRLSATMHEHMGAHACFSRKALAAARVLACESYLLLTQLLEIAEGRWRSHRKTVRLLEVFLFLFRLINDAIFGLLAFINDLNTMCRRCLLSFHLLESTFSNQNFSFIWTFGISTNCTACIFRLLLHCLHTRLSIFKVRFRLIKVFF